MRFAEALAELEARQEARIKLGLDRVRVHLARLDNPHERVPAFHVAGTNGKGSTCAMLSSVLRASGRRTGLYISPHLSDVCERISVDGRSISKSDFARLMAKTLAADPRRELTYFELLTSVAFQHFAQSRCDVSVLETGMGGRLDATNVVSRPLAAVVTSVDYDHQRFLGRTLQRIAAQKTGIFKPGCPAIFPDIPVLRRAAKHGQRIAVSRPWSIIRVDWSQGFQILRSAEGQEYQLSLLGARQGWNAALARAAVEASGLEVGERSWRKGLACVFWPGRVQAIRDGKKTLIVDGAHNPEAARALAATYLASPWSKSPARWVLGLLRDKDAVGVIEPLAPFLGDVVAVKPPSSRALKPRKLAAVVRRCAPRARIAIADDPAEALDSWRSDRNSPAVAVCAGSLYLAGAALKAFGRPA